MQLGAATADKSTRDRQQSMLLHCCPQSETLCLKKCARYLAGRIKLVDGSDAAYVPYSLATPGVATHTQKSQ